MALSWGSSVPQCNIVTRMPLATMALICKQTTDNFQICPPPELPICGVIYRVTVYFSILIE